jgi:lysophospholipid acyltransferase (LPLAT)-like uncharacterized protein
MSEIGVGGVAAIATIRPAWLILLPYPGGLPLKIRSPLLNKLAIWFGVRLVKLLYWTCRKEIVGDAPNLSSYESTGDKRYLYCVWHDQIVMTLFTGRPQNMSGLVSRHQDGGYVADVMQALDIRPVRGSTKRGGSEAMRELMDAAADLHVAITPDGPRGPRHVPKTGIVFLASHSGRGIVPVAYSCRRCWKIEGSWTDMMIPKPFTTIYARGGVPIYVPPNLKRNELDQYTASLQSEMDRLEADAERLARGEALPEVVERKAAA